jgi:hypothetical protein
LTEGEKKLQILTWEKPAGGRGSEEMENLKFGLTMTVLGMGGTLAILFLISLAVRGLNKFMIRGDKRREARGRS